MMNTALISYPTWINFGDYDSPFGTAGEDFLSGSYYGETFIGKEGDNAYETGAGGDKIIIEQHAGGQDTITDFDQQKDVISLSNFSGVEFYDLWISLSGNNTHAVFPNGQLLILQNVSALSVSAENFVYGPYALSWGSNSDNTVIINFNVEHDFIDLNYAFSSNNLSIYEENGSSVIEVVGNSQRWITIM
jgi:hypothetical protein